MIWWKNTGQLADTGENPGKEVKEMSLYGFSRYLLDVTVMCSLTFQQFYNCDTKIDQNTGAIMYNPADCSFAEGITDEENRVGLP